MTTILITAASVFVLGNAWVLWSICAAASRYDDQIERELRGLAAQSEYQMAIAKHTRHRTIDGEVNRI